MDVIRVRGKDCRVRRPCYVRGPVKIITKRGKLTGVRCKLLFPATDPAIVDRVPIVNSGVCVLGGLNLTNIGAEWLGRGRLIAQQFKVESFGIVYPDKLIDAELVVPRTLRETRRGRVTGKAVITLSRRRKLLVRISVARFTELKRRNIKQL